MRRKNHATIIHLARTANVSLSHIKTLVKHGFGLFYLYELLLKFLKFINLPKMSIFLHLYTQVQHYPEGIFAYYHQFMDLVEAFSTDITMIREQQHAEDSSTEVVEEMGTDFRQKNNAKILGVLSVTQDLILVLAMDIIYGFIMTLEPRRVGDSSMVDVTEIPTISYHFVYA